MNEADEAYDKILREDFISSVKIAKDLCGGDVGLAEKVGRELLRAHPRVESFKIAGTTCYRLKKKGSVSTPELEKDVSKKGEESLEGGSGKEEETEQDLEAEAEGQGQAEEAGAPEEGSHVRGGGARLVKKKVERYYKRFLAEFGEKPPVSGEKIIRLVEGNPRYRKISDEEFTPHKGMRRKKAEPKKRGAKKRAAKRGRVQDDPSTGGEENPRLLEDDASRFGSRFRVSRISIEATTSEAFEVLSALRESGKCPELALSLAAYLEGLVK